MRVAYLATADARGHLMRAQLLMHACRAQGIAVDVLTTSDDGARFLAGFGVTAPVLSRHYAVQFDQLQNMLRRETDRNVAAYVFFPTRMLRDIVHLRAWMANADVVINDSFHPALLVMGCLPVWRDKIVHVYGASLRHALEHNFEGRTTGWLSRLFRKIIRWQVEASRGRIEHDFAYSGPERHAHTYRLPTPIASARAHGNEVIDEHSPKRVAVYLNPHFRDPQLAHALEQGIDAAGMHGHYVGEGYAKRKGWCAQDSEWVAIAARSGLVISAPGMAALSVAALYGLPMLLILTEQPEQMMNAKRAGELGLSHRIVVWRDDAQDFACAVEAACRALSASIPFRQSLSEGERCAQARLNPWVAAISALAMPAS